MHIENDYLSCLLRACIGDGGGCYNHEHHKLLVKGNHMKSQLLTFLQY